MGLFYLLLNITLGPLLGPVWPILTYIVLPLISAAVRLVSPGSSQSSPCGCHAPTLLGGGPM